ncbi:MAG: undecaprenyl-diphosphate phosphatase [Mycobacteriales bacterium]
MTPLQRAALGVVQGVAEVAPVSSSAQLALLPWLLRWPQPEDRTAFAAALHAGSCAGLAVAHRRDLLALDRRTAGRVLLSTVPAGVAGLVAQDAVERRLGRPGPTAALLAGAGVLLWAADRRPQDRSVGGRETALAAAAQVLALAPGVSRAGATLTALRLARVGRADAVRFSTLMSLPVTAGAAGLTCLRAGRRPPVVPTALAGATALVAAARLDPTGPRFVSGSALYRLGLAAAVAARLRKERR